MATRRHGREFDVLAVGDLNVDLVMGGLQAAPRFGGEVLAESMSLHAGGSTASFAMCSARLGLKTALVANVGQDTFGAFLLRELEEAHVDTLFVARHETLSTGLTVSLSHAGDRAFVTHLAAIDALTGEEVGDELLVQSAHLHVGGYYLQSRLRPGLAALSGRARKLGLTTSLDTGYDPAERWNDELLEVLEQTDLFLPNGAEATGIARESDPLEALRVLGRRCQAVALKLGAEGAAATRDGELWRCAARPTEVVDTTCCGDAFDAGFVQAWLEGCELEQCLARGNVCGSLVATTPGNSAALLADAGVRQSAEELLAAGAAVLVEDDLGRPTS